MSKQVRERGQGVKACHATPCRATQEGEEKGTSMAKGGKERTWLGMGGEKEREAGTHLVAPNLLGDVIQRLDDTQPEFLALLVFPHDDVFDVAHET